jgi:putative Holliday junction resolvase
VSLFAQYANKYRALGLDYGDKRTGVALSDIGWNIASPLIVLDSHKIFSELLAIIRDNSVKIVVVGLPIALGGGRHGKQLEKVVKFTGILKNKLSFDEAMDVLFWDERLSSVAAHRALSETGASMNNRKKNVDKIAASFILQGFLDGQKQCFVRAPYHSN